MHMNQKEILDSLRAAAERDQWNLCRDTVTMLLRVLPPAAELEIVTKHIRRFLVDFARSHPQDEDIAHFIGTVYRKTDDKALRHDVEHIETMLDKYWDEPGVSNFRNALKRLSRLSESTSCQSEYIDAVVNILSGVIMAIDIHNWGKANHSLWQLFFKDNPTAGIMTLAKHWSDPERVQLRKSIWFDVANDIEMMLSAE